MYEIYRDFYPIELVVQEYLDEFDLPSLSKKQKDENTLECMKKVVIPENYDLVIAHPTFFGDEFETANVYHARPGRFLNILLEYHIWEAENNIWLWSCNSGSNGLAETISNLSGVIVKAPIEKLFCTFDGYYFVADIELNEAEEWYNNGYIQENDGDQYLKWKIFYPEDYLDSSEQYEIVTAFEAWFAQFLPEYSTFEEYCEDMSNIYEEDFSPDTIFSNAIQRRKLWQTLLN